MDKDKLRGLILHLKTILEELETEFFSDDYVDYTEEYSYQISDYDEVFEEDNDGY